MAEEQAGVVSAVDGFRRELRELINRRSMEGWFGNTPDIVLADFIMDLLEAYTDAVMKRDQLQLSPFNVEVLPLQSAQARREFACVESTFDCRVGGLELRVWRKSDINSASAHTESAMRDRFGDVMELLMRKHAAEWTQRSLAVEVAKLPDVAAVQVRMGRELQHNGDYSTGIVIYVDWP